MQLCSDVCVLRIPFRNEIPHYNYSFDLSMNIITERDTQHANVRMQLKSTVVFCTFMVST